jgi:hypothetical protein
MVGSDDGGRRAPAAREMVEARAEEAKGISCRAGVGCGWASGALKAGY